MIVSALAVQCALDATSSTLRVQSQLALADSFLPVCYYVM